MRTGNAGGWSWLWDGYHNYRHSLRVSIKAGNNHSDQYVTKVIFLCSTIVESVVVFFVVVVHRNEFQFSVLGTVILFVSVKNATRCCLETRNGCGLLREYFNWVLKYMKTSPA